MAKVCRVGDKGQGVCLGHKSPTPFTTTFITGDISTADGQPIATVGTLGQASCGHMTRATTGSSIVEAMNGQKVHRVGDQGVSLAGGTYTAISGSPVVDAD